MKYSIKQHIKVDDHFHVFNSDNIQYFESIKKYIIETKNVDGDIVECGIGRGRSLISLCYLKNELKLNKKIYAFDSFDGFGNISKYDQSPRKPKNKDWSHSPHKKIKYTKRFIEKVIKLHIHKDNQVKFKLIKGFVERTLPIYSKKIKKISFINCDVDLYNGHKSVLENLWINLSKNGIIYFDDVFQKKKKKLSFPGARIAYDEFFKSMNKKNYKEIIDIKRGNLIVKKLI